MEMGMSIDWITASKVIPLHADATEYNFGLYVARSMLVNANIKWAQGKDWKASKPLRFYKYGYETSEGIRFDVAEKISHQGVRLTLSGSTLTKMEQKPEDILTKLIDEGWKITRLDVALDVFGSGLKPHHIMKQWIEANIGLGHRSYSYHESATGSTFGVGSRQSPVYGRCYDKGGEQGTHNDWLRFELEFKYEGADQFAPLCRWGAANAWAEVSRRFALSNTWLGEIVKDNFGNRDEEYFSRKRTVTNTEKWLMEQVFSAFKKLARKDADAALRFFEACAVHLANSDNQED